MTGWRAAVATTAAGVVFLISWGLLHHAWWGRHQIVDTPVYQEYGDAIVHGRVPYRDFYVEYPPGALAAFLAPELTAAPGDFGAYGRSFEKWMAGCGLALVLVVGWGLTTVRARFSRGIAALGLVATSPLLLGNVMLSRFDLLPAALTAAAVAALLAEWELTAAVALGLAISVKLYALALAPIALVWLLRRRGRRRAVTWSVVATATVAVVLLPFAIVAPGVLGHSLGEPLHRPVQIESLPAAILLAAHHLAGVRLEPLTSFGSQNLGGSAATAVGSVTTGVGLVALLGVWIAFARGRMTPGRLAAAAASALTVVVAFSHVFSPQYLIWLIPLVALALDAAATAALAAALVLTQIWFPDRYWQLALQQQTFESWLVVARDLLAVALAALLARPLLEDDGLRERRAARKPLEPVRRQVQF